MDLVDAQQARRVLDRVVGYTISDLLWKKVKKGLSGGRVQSVALRLICDREGEIREFIPEEYWTLGAKLKDADGKGFEAKFYGKGETKTELANEAETNEVLDGLKGKDFAVTDVKQAADRKARCPLYHKYHAAGGEQAPEHGNTENHDDCAAAV